MFYDHPQCIKLADRIYIFKNIIPKEMSETITKDLNTFVRGSNDNDWSVRDWYQDKMTHSFPSSFPLWKFMSELIHPEIVIHPVTNFMMAMPGDEGMFVHSDSPGKGNCHMLLEIDQWTTCCELEYGMIAYFGEFTGGKLFYPNINPDGSVKEGLEISKERLEEPCFEVQPEPGDIVLHGACSPYDHGTRETESGVRFAFSCFALLAEDNPGTFYNYKTPEWYEQIGKYENPTDDQLNAWNSPLRANPQFAEMIEEKTKIINEKMLNKKNNIIDLEK
jgi:hypothetical protein